MHPQNIWTILVTHATVQGILLFVFLVFSKGGNPTARRSIGALCLLFSLLRLGAMEGEWRRRAIPVSDLWRIEDSEWGILCVIN